jgi:Xaa-Pro dipeptidase
MAASPAALGSFREWMAEVGAGVAFLTSPVSIGYLTGFRAEPHERLLALIVLPERATLLVPSLEVENAEGAASGAAVQGWRDGEDPWRLVGGAIGPVRSGSLAVEKGHLTITAFERLRDVGARLELVDAGPRLQALRARKRGDELELLRRAARITDEIADWVWGAAAAGGSELELAAGIDLRVAQTGARPSFQTLVQSGPNSALPHGSAGGRVLRPGELLLFDFGAAWDGYCADLTRTATVGEPDARQREVHAVVLAAHDAAVAAVRPGVTAGEVDAAARAVIQEAGLGDRFVHRVGHGLGLEAHEAPSLDPGSSTVLEEGMVITIEPGVYVPGWGGVRIEDDLVVEAGGAAVLTHADRRLRVVGG